MFTNLEEHPDYLRWIVYDGSFSVKMRPGFELFLRPNCAHSQRRFLFRELERNELDFLKEKNFQNFVCFDIGANIGYFSKWLLSLFNVKEVHSFEPDPINFEILLKNTLDFSNSFVNQSAVSDKSGKVELFLNPISSGDNSIYSSTVNDRIVVDCLTVDEYVDKKNISTIDFLKIDIQGAEISAINGGLYSIRKFRPMIYMEYTPEDVNINALDLYDFILKFSSNFNFKIYCIDHGRLKLLSNDDLKSFRGNLIINPKF